MESNPTPTSQLFRPSTTTLKAHTCLKHALLPLDVEYLGFIQICMKISSEIIFSRSLTKIVNFANFDRNFDESFFTGSNAVAADLFVPFWRRTSYIDPYK